MPAACPRCHTYDGLTTDMKYLGEGKFEATGKIQCENCLWVGESDELDQVDSDAD